MHHYTFTLIATTHGVKDLPPGLTREAFFEKSAGKLLAVDQPFRLRIGADERGWKEFWQEAYPLNQL